MFLISMSPWIIVSQQFFDLLKAVNVLNKIKLNQDKLISLYFKILHNIKLVVYTDVPCGILSIAGADTIFLQAEKNNCVYHDQ